MNVAELARKLKVNVQELKQILPEMGFDIGQKAIKINDQVAQKVLVEWPKFKKELKKEKIEEIKEIKEKNQLIILPSILTVRELATKLDLPITKIITELMKNGILTSQNERIDYETAAVIAEDLGFQVKLEGEKKEIISQDDKIKNLLKEEDKNKLKPRPPVIVVMGHVDHGKTKLLDAIRKTNIAAEESGGITQHIGAYQVEKNNRLMTFIDTPGHEAFTTMRSRGARIADIAVLVIAADDGIKPQTLEAIKIIQAAKLPFVVAINKIDKQETNIEKVKQDLASHNLLPEDWGGKTICIPISAKNGQNIDQLLDIILLLADMDKENITANPEKMCAGTVIESKIDKGEGLVATILIQGGTLKKGNFLVINNTLYGKARALKNYKGENIEQAPPGMPVRILGFKITPQVGDILEGSTETKNLEKKAKFRKQTIQEAVSFLSEEEEEKIKKLNIILKTDVLGSQEAILSSLEKFKHPEIKIKIVSKGLGNITETDVLFAETNSALLMGFNVTAPLKAENLAKEKEIQIKIYKIIYELLNYVKEEMEKMLSPEIIKEELGKIKVLAVFKKEKNSMIIGGRVIQGKIIMSPEVKIRVIRNKELLEEGELKQLQINKENTLEAREGQECGINFKGRSLIEKDDILEIYKEIKQIKKIII